MPRPPKHRFVAGQPAVTVYKPAGIRARQLRWTNLALDEFEAIRLIDGDGLDQEAVAARMGVSRPTVTRILASARAKIARVLVAGQALLIEGGPVVQGTSGRRGRCGRHGGGHGDRRGRQGSGRGDRRGARRWGGTSQQSPKEAGMNVVVTAQGPDLDSALDPRFGRARYLVIVDSETGEVDASDNSRNLDAARGAGNQTARAVARLGADAVITGRVGPRAFKTLSAAGIEIFTGATGSVQDAIEQFTTGRLERAVEPDRGRRGARGRTG